MCFSASASFIASASLGVLGVGALKSVHNRSQYAFAAIPFIFATQQFTEGIIWLSMTHPEYARHQEWSTMVYLLFAQVIWPIWLPLAFYFLKKTRPVKKY